jgi:hypothetical protein
MKNQIILSLFLLTFFVVPQTNGQVVDPCADNFITTNPASPTNERCTLNDRLNSFDWIPNVTNTTFQTPHYTGSSLMNSPFARHWLAFPSASVSEEMASDILPEDGWELIFENISLPINGTNDALCMVYYNKFSSVLRVWIAVDSKITTPTNNHRIDIEFGLRSPMSGVLHPVGAYAQTMDKKSISKASVTFASPNSPTKFFLAEFPVEYDPCSCNNRQVFSIKVYDETTQNIVLQGGYKGVNQSIPLLAENNDFLLAMEDSIGTITSGAYFYKNVMDLINDYESYNATAAIYKKRLDNIKQAKQAIEFMATASLILTGVGAPAASALATSTQAAQSVNKLLTSAGKRLKTTSDLAKGIGGPLADYYSGKIQGKYNAAKGKADLVGSATVTLGNITINGVMSNSTEAGFELNLDVPGANHPNDNCSASVEVYPKYDRSLGRFAVLETPKVEVAINPPVANPYIFDARAIAHRVRFDKSNFKYTFNPGADVNINNTVIYAGLMIKTKKNGTPTITDAVSLNILDIQVTNPNETVIYSQFVPLECLENLVASFTYNGGFSTYQNNGNFLLGDYEVTDVYLKLVINYEFNQLNRDGFPNRAVQVLTYPMEIVQKAYNQIPAPISNGSEPIVDSLHIGTNTNYTTSQTIFAWEKIVINADLTAASGVEVRFIAPEIEIIGGSLGQGISTEVGFFPTSCAPLTPAAESVVQSFCSSTIKQMLQNTRVR